MVEVDMKSPSRRNAWLAAVAAAVLAGASLPSSGVAVSSHKPQYSSVVMRHLNATAAAHAKSGGDDDAGDVAARAEYEAAIESAPSYRADARQLAAAQHRAQRLPASGHRWQALTDRPYLHDPAPGYGPELFSDYGVGYGLVTGRITGLAASGVAVFASSADGGVWKSTDRGAHWKAFSNGLPRLATGAIETNPADGSVWVGLGEANQAFENLPGFGVYRLAKGAHHWVRVGGSELMSRAVFHIHFIGRWAFAATDHGLYRHSRSSTSRRWHRVLHPDPNPTHSLFRTSPISDVVAVPGYAGKIVMAVQGDPGSGTEPTALHNGFYVSHHWGAAGTFHKIRPRGDINADEIGRVTLSGTRSRGPLYAVVEDSKTQDLEGEGVFVSRTGSPAGPWNLIADVAKLAKSGSALSPDPKQYHPGIQSWYNQYVKVDPAHPNHVYLGLEEIFETINGGRTWLAIAPYNAPCAGTKPYTCPATVHPDQHAVTFSHGQMYAGSDGGVWRRSMGNHRARGWTNLNATIHTLQYYSADSGRVGSGRAAVYGGLQDNAASLLRPNGSFVDEFTGDGGDIVVNPHNAADVMNEYVYLDVTTSTDFGRHDVEISPACGAFVSPPATCDQNPLFIAPMERDPHQARHIVVGGQYVWQSYKGWNTRCSAAGCDWKIAHDVGSPGPTESTSAIGVDGPTIYAGWVGQLDPHPGIPFTRGMSTNVGGHWHELSMKGLPNRYITSLTVDPNNARHVYASFGGFFATVFPAGRFGHVWESTNGGKSWHNISGNLPNAPLHKLVIWHHRLVVGGDVGTFVAGMHGGTWQRMGLGLPHATVWDLSVAPGGRYLIAATHGRGQWALHAG
jgi:hypothetical protein